MVAVASVTVRRTIEKSCHVVKLLLVIVSLNHWKHLTLKQFGTNHEDTHISPLSDDSGISHDINRRTVNEYVVELLAQFLDKSIETRVVEQLCWVRWYRTYRDDAEVLGIRCLNHRTGIDSTSEVVRNTLSRIAYILTHT